jgi:hypothetical protein
MGHSAVIDASTFAAEYGGFWKSVTPTCELFVRWANLSGYERWSRPLVPQGATRRALTAEVAFALFCRRHQKAESGDGLGEIASALSETVERLAPFASEGLDLESPLSATEQDEIDKISMRLDLFFRGEEQPRVLRPVFRGCGFIGASEGDVLCADTLYEVKTVDRTYRSSDFRQLLAYCALNAASNQFEFNRVGICNPRRGTSVVVSVEELVFEASGKEISGELLSEIVYAISGPSISR